jgi:hypothetical protein
LRKCFTVSTPTVWAHLNAPEYYIVLKKYFAVPWIHNDEHGSKVADHKGAVVFINGFGFSKERNESKWYVFVALQSDDDLVNIDYRKISNG